MIKNFAKTVAIILLSLPVFGQSKFVLNGSVQGAHAGSVELKIVHQELLDDKGVSTVNLNNRGFKFDGLINNPVRAFLILTDRNGRKLYTPTFFIDKGTQSISLDSATFEHSVPVFTGSATNDLNQLYLKELQATELLLNPLADSLDVLKNSNLKNDDAKSGGNIENLQRLINDKRDDFTVTYVKTHKDSYLSLWIIDSCLRERFSKKLEKAFDLLSPDIQQSKLGAATRKGFSDVQSVMTGGYLPSLKFVDITGKEKIERFRPKDKYLFVELWFSHCAPCLARLPALKEVYERKNDFGLEFIGISVRETNQKDWKNTIKNYKIPWLQFYDIKGLFLNAYKVHIFPSNLLIDAGGKVVARDLEPTELLQFLKSAKRD